MSRHRQAALGEITPLASFVRCRFPTPPLLSPPCFAGGPRVAVEPTARSELSNAPRAVVLDWQCDRPGLSPGPSAGPEQWRCALVRGRTGSARSLPARRAEWHAEGCSHAEGC